MPLPIAFDHTILAHACPHCGHHREGIGSWFKTIPHYECEACRQLVRVGYSDKVALFEKAYMQQIGAGGEAQRRQG